MKMEEYRCAECGGVFEKGWSEEEAMAERKNNNWTDMDCALVCDDCYKKIMRQFQ